jgi:hypothetical protein
MSIESKTLHYRDRKHFNGEAPMQIAAGWQLISKTENNAVEGCLSIGGSLLMLVAIAASFGLVSGYILGAVVGVIIGSVIFLAGVIYMFTAKGSVDATWVKHQ